MDAPVIAIDGPSGTGKGTLAMRLTSWLGWHLLDSGALYRLVGYHAGRLGIALDDEPALARIAQSLPAEFVVDSGTIKVLLGDREVTDEIRSETAGSAASVVAAVPAVRAGLLARQREFRQAPGLVADGRDMGTVVFPDAPLKIYLTASPAERAQRRYKQLKQKGIDVNLARLSEDIAARDQRDQEREVSPLRPASDAIILDTTALDIVAVEESVRALAKERGLV